MAPRIEPGVPGTAVTPWNWRLSFTFRSGIPKSGPATANDRYWAAASAISVEVTSASA